MGEEFELGNEEDIQKELVGYSKNEVEEVKDAIEEFEEPKERKIYKGKKNYRGLDYIAGQEPKHAAMLKMQVRGCIAWLDGEDKMSYKDVVMLPYADFMDLLRQFTKSTGIEGGSF